MGWRPIKDELILHRWKCVCDGRNDPEGIRWDSSSYTLEVSPDYYEQHGTPSCIDCCQDMEYMETLLDCGFDPIRETLVVKQERKKSNE